MLRTLGAMLCLFPALLAAEIRVLDSRGEQVLAQRPQRIVALNWDLAEQLLELEVVPVGVPNIRDYHTWVVDPAIPESVVDLGTRAEPNLSVLAGLKPDLILAATPQRDLLPRLERIAPVLYFETYARDHNAAEAAIENLRQIARVVGKTELAERKLAAMATRFATLREQLAAAFPTPPEVAAIRFANTASVYLYGENSTTVYALEQLGLIPALPQPPTQWGMIRKRLLALEPLGEGYLLYFEPFAQRDALMASVLWQALPFVRAGHVNGVAPVWNYGGALSIQRIGEGIAASLLEIAPR